MSVTNRILELDQTLKIHDEGEWSGVATEYVAFNDAGIECEVGEYLYGLVRLLKPDNVLETGTHVGIGACYLGMALKDNQKGRLDTVEYLPELHKEACRRVRRVGLADFVSPKFGDVKDMIPTVTYDLILLDTEPNLRFAEFEKFYPYLKGGGFIFIHDLHRHMHQIPNDDHGFAWPFGLIPPKIRGLVNSGEIKPFHYASPRGLTGFYKTHPEDYKF